MTIAQLQLLLWVGIIFGGADQLLSATRFVPILGWPHNKDCVMCCSNERLYVKRAADDAFRNVAMHVAAEREQQLNRQDWTRN